MPSTAEMRQSNSEAIKAAIHQLNVINYDTVSEHIPKLLTKGQLKLEPSAYTPVNPKQVNDIGRYLVYDHSGEKPFSIWAFALGPKQKTSIHDHKYRGTVTVLEGPVSEKYYRKLEENTALENTALLVKRADRYRFHTNSDDLTDNFVHQLKRRIGLGQEGTSVTLHIYEMEAHLIIKDEKVENKNLSTIFTKVKTVNSPDKGEYEELRGLTPS